MKNKPKISIIIPAYNAEKTIKETLTSISNQSFKDFEVIIVDDGSNDNTANIVYDFCRLDNRFKLIKQENAGVSVARNTGLDSIKGEWVCFIDADDLVSQNYLYSLNQNSFDTDVIISNKINEFIGTYNNKVNQWDIKAYVNTSPLLYIIDNKIGVYVWGKLYKISYIKKYNLYFNTLLNVGEDFEFNIKYFSYVQVLKFSNAEYYYRISSSSLSNKFEKKLLEERLKAADIMSNFLLDNKILTKEKSDLLYISYGVFGCLRYIIKNKKYFSILNLIKKIMFKRIKIRYIKYINKKWFVVYTLIFLSSLVMR